jgi:hypothetical protein
LLVGNELWGFISPSTIDLSLVRDATAKVQPYYAVPSQYLATDEFPMTRNGKIDKRALAGLAESDNCEGVKRLSIRNKGVPFNPNLPGTPDSIKEQPALKWSGPAGAPSPPLPDTLSLSSHVDSKDTARPDQGQNGRGDGQGPSFVLDDVLRMVCVNAV